MREALPPPAPYLSAKGGGGGGFMIQGFLWFSSLSFTFPATAEWMCVFFLLLRECSSQPLILSSSCTSQVDANGTRLTISDWNSDITSYAAWYAQGTVNLYPRVVRQCVRIQDESQAECAHYVPVPALNASANASDSVWTCGETGCADGFLVVNFTGIETRDETLPWVACSFNHKAVCLDCTRLPPQVAARTNCMPARSYDYTCGGTFCYLIFCDTHRPDVCLDGSTWYLEEGRICDPCPTAYFRAPAQVRWPM